jgi:hypothetical protein
MKTGSVAIMPPGALGVSFFYYLTDSLQRLEGDVFLVGLDDSRSIDSLLQSGIQISDGNGLHQLPTIGNVFRNLDDVRSTSQLPEILIACPNPDQLLQVISTYVALIERIWAANPVADELRKIPAVVLSSNGIYFQRVRQMFIEKLEESTLLGRLPDLWPDEMPHIVGHLLRGVTVQTGARFGSGGATTYSPGPSGLSILAGGGVAVRQRCYLVLKELGARVELAENSSPTRLEFEKAVINLTSNLLGLLYALQDDGSFQSLKVGEIVFGERENAARELSRQVFEVGCAVKAFTPADDFDTIYSAIALRMQGVRNHVPSSLQAVKIQIDSGKLEVKCPPTESWLLDPLVHYARSAGLTDAVSYFEGLREQLIVKLQKAADVMSS